MPEIAFSVFIPQGRSVYYVEWTIPRTKRRVRRSTGCTRERDAQRKASAIIDEWFRGRGREGDEAWGRFREAHANEVQPSLAIETRRKYETVFDAIEAAVNPVSLSDLTSRAISKLQAKWRGSKLSEHSIRTYLAHLSKSLAWAKSQGMLAEVPAIERPQLAKKERKAKGRPISLEEFERMLAAVSNVVKEPSAVAGWQRLLRGLWLSGLRLGEAVKLSWDDRQAIRVDLDGPFPALLIPSSADKGRKDRVIPIVPDFAAMLAEVPPAERRGVVFALERQRKGDGSPSDVQYISAVISRIGKAAGVIVGTYTASGKTKFASAHDLRRSFGRRWASKVQNVFDLQTLMRHASIETTRAYYAHEDAEGLAERLSEIAISFAITDHDRPASATLANTEK